MILIWFKSDLMILCQLCYFQDNVHAPVSKAILEVKSRTLGISKAWLRLHAHFRGLRYLMYHYPLTSGIVGITSISIFLFSMLLLAFSKVVDPIQVKCFYPRCYVRTTPRGSKFCFVVVDGNEHAHIKQHCSAALPGSLSPTALPASLSRQPWPPALPRERFDSEIETET
jgi:hypothetical protein